MAAVNFSPSGFSYAQAARGQVSAPSSQPPSSKVTSGSTSPAAGILTETTTKSSWADDVEATVAVKASEPSNPQQDDQKISSPKESPADTTKPDEKPTNGVSGVSSPDLAASSSTAAKEDDLFSPPNESYSPNALDSKPQVSEGSWIAERKERQSAPESTEKPSKAEKKSKEPAAQPPPKSVDWQEAAPPTVNFWTKRAEEAKAKVPVIPKAPVPTPPSDTPAHKENQRPRADTRRKANSVASIPPQSLANTISDIVNRSNAQDKRSGDLRTQQPGRSSKPGPDDDRSDTPLSTSTRPKPIERQSLPDLANTTTPAADEVSWPTPDIAQERERKDAAEKESEEKRDEEATPAGKRKKPVYTVLPVVPTFLYETQGIKDSTNRSRGAANGERGAKNGNGGRSRGAYRGAPNGTAGGDRQTSRTSPSPGSGDNETSTTARGQSVVAEKGAAAPPARPSRAASANSVRERKSDLNASRIQSSQGLADALSSDRNVTDARKSEDTSTTTSRKSQAETRRTKSPQEIDADESKSKSDDFVPEPIPRRNSTGAQTPKTVEAAESSVRDSTTPKTVQSENRKESRSFDNSFDTPRNATRGAKRGGRGRGGNGNRDLANGHPGGNGSPGNYAPEFAGPSYGVQPSQSPYQVQRGHHQFTYPFPGRGGWNNRGNPRSQSIPIDNNYYQRVAQYAPPQLQTVQPYVPGMYDPNGVPMTAIPYPNQMDTQYLIEMVTVQLNYYFSIDNLLKDMFLRKHMDSQGFVLMDIIANFNRIRQLTQERDVIKTACINSDDIEIRIGEDGKERLRVKKNWEQFLLPMEQRDESAQNHGPEHLQRPERPQLQMSNSVPQFRGPASAGIAQMQPPRFDRRSYESIYPTMNGGPSHYGNIGGIPEVMYRDLPNGEETRGRAAKSPIHESPISPMGQPMNSVFEERDPEPDVFPDDQVGALTVVVRMSQQRVPYHSLASRTFSNGSIDSRSIIAEQEKSVEAESQPKSEGPPIVNGSDLQLASIPRRASPNKPRSSDRASGDSELRVYWDKAKDAPVKELPSDLTPEPYLDLRRKALDQRNHAATGNCPYDMDILYQFWAHFLIRNFNNRMYSEFKQYANEDVLRHNTTGMDNLVRFYHQSLTSPNPIRDRVARDYVRLAQDEPSALKGAAFKNLRSAWRNGALNLKNRKKLADIVDEKLKELLDRLDA